MDSLIAIKCSACGSEKSILVHKPEADNKFVCVDCGHDFTVDELNEQIANAARELVIKSIREALKSGLK